MNAPAPASTLLAPRADGRRPVVLLAGNPNSGKTTLFNALTGARARVGNYPGVTVERRSGHVRLGGVDVDVVDLPGTYSLSASSPEEAVAIEAILRDGPDAIVVVTDAGALARGLYLVTQIADIGVPCVVALNMMDEVRRAGVEIDVARLGHELGVEVVPMVASRGQGRAELEQALSRALRRGGRPMHVTPPPAAAAEAVLLVEAALAEAAPRLTPAARRARATWALLSVGEDELAGVPAGVRKAVEQARAIAHAAEVDLDLVLVADRYRRVDALVAECLSRTRPRARSLTDRIDAFATHRLWGTIAFVLVMALVFQALFAWSQPAIDLIASGIASMQSLVASILPSGTLRDLLVQGVIAGVGNVIAFVPQILLLFLFIGLLEDSGYLARVAFVIDRLMARVGLHGRAFVPMLSGYACAIPAVLATRTIENRRDRLLTMLVIPLTSCSARLPVYVLVIGTLFAGGKLGPFSQGAIVLLAMYVLSATAALSAAAVLRRTALRGPSPALVLELPPYRVPVARNLVASAWRHLRSFLVDAGSIILAINIVLWALLSFPKDGAVHARYQAARARTTDAAELARLDAAEGGEQLRHSIAGRAGRAMEPALEPLGLDWRVGIGIMGAFAAREVFVSTMGTVFDIGEGADEHSRPLRDALRDARRPDGSRLFTTASGLALMVFFVFAMQCMSTIAVVRRESGSWKWPIAMFTWMTTLAYVAAFATYHVARALGYA
jgi:ferrous iron transport protein B